MMLPCKNWNNLEDCDKPTCGGKVRAGPRRVPPPAPGLQDLRVVREAAVRVPALPAHVREAQLRQLRPPLPHHPEHGGPESGRKALKNQGVLEKGGRK